MSISPSIWGKPLWEMFNCIAFAYPDTPTDEQKTDVINFFNSVKKILPCGECKQHFIKLLEEHSIENNIANREQLLRWVNMIHNKVNVRLGKPEYSYEQLLDLLVYGILGEAKPEPAPQPPPQAKKPVAQAAGRGVARKTIKVNSVPVIRRAKPQLRNKTIIKSKIIPKNGCACSK